MSNAVARIPSSTLTSLLPRALHPHVAVVDPVATRLITSEAFDSDEAKPLEAELSRLLPYLGHDELTAAVLRAGHSHPLPTLHQGKATGRAAPVRRNAIQLLSEARFLLMEMVGSGLSSEGFALKVLDERHVKVGKLLTCLNMVSPIRKKRLGRRLDGESIMAEMIESGLQPKEAICAALVCGFCKEGALNRAELILKAFVLDFHVFCNESYNALMRAYCETRSTKESLALPDMMLELGFVPSSEACRIADPLSLGFQEVLIQ
ncbi:hypothetical protein GUJ93_ZPchr0008g13064 [Zizania palustris]|uniref:Pentatricopeptide repeat-containing protein n=1 Tax=Zizania palustris TaxID=103762 RepID=A0A8J5R3I2_ZIZPA|nr:hypothetical protein GUJ93_ZPchr0008g13064 [Zizania palustris]